MLVNVIEYISISSILLHGIFYMHSCSPQEQQVTLGSSLASQHCMLCLPCPSGVHLSESLVRKEKQYLI